MGAGIMNTLVVNAGGSTLKVSGVASDGAVVAAEDVDPWDGTSGDAIARVAEAAAPIVAVGHRVVHGGSHLGAPRVFTEALDRVLLELAPLAPLHQERAVAAARIARDLLPHAAHVACFDTWFHRTIGAAASTYALPEEWRDRWALQRFGFHGWSHSNVARRVRMVLQRRRPVDRIISCHLGSGASLCAIHRGRSVDTTMGLTPSEGLVMATRAGSVDPGLVLWLINEVGIDPREVDEGLRLRGGLAGLSGTSGDMRDVLAGVDRGDRRCRHALDVYLHRLRREIGAMAAALGGVDVVAFTGGVGVHLPVVRALACGGLGHLGVAIDPDRNAAMIGDGDVSAPWADSATVVVATAEHLEIARATREFLGRSTPTHARSGRTDGAGRA
jgi:acetate kinase